MTTPTQVGNLSHTAAAWQTQIAQSDRVADMLPGVSLRSSASPNGLINSQEMFKAFFQTEVDKIKGSLAGPVGPGFSEIAESGLKAIMDKTFGAMTTELLTTGNITNAKATMQTAHAEALEVLGTLKAVAEDVQASRSDGPGSKVPQLVKGSDGYNLIRSAPKLENIVLKGGGAKGIGYPGALDEMQKSGMLSDLKRVAGTSAGALTAVSLAVGQSSEKFEALSNKNMLGLMVGGGDLKASYPELGFKNGISKAEAMPMVQLLDKITTDEVKDFVEGLKPGALAERVDQYILANPGKDRTEVLNRLATLSNPDFTSDRTGKMVTFNDMKMLHQLAPEKFKELTLTGWDSHDQQPIVFRADDRYGDLPVIFAARASMAHPAIASGITLPERFGHGNHAIQDGGIGSNMPSEVFYGDDRNLASMDTTGNTALQETRARTAVLIFDEGGKAHKSLHDPSAQSMKPKDVGLISRMVAHNDEMGVDNKYDNIKQYGAGPNAFVVAHGTMGTLSLLASDSTKSKAIQQSRDVMIEQLALRQDQAYALEVDSPAAAYAMLDASERRAIYDQGPPKLDNSMTEENYRAARDLYDLAWSEFAPQPNGTGNDTLLRI